MISLRTVTTAFLGLASLTLVACSDGPVAPVSKAISPSTANFDGKVGSTGNSAKNGDIDVRVLLDKSGNALLVIRTGSYNPTTNVASPDGYFDNIQYKIYDTSGRQVQVKNVKFTKTGVDYYWTYVNLCASSSDDDDDDAGTSSTSCSTHYASNWSVSVQANLKDVGGDVKKTDVVREDGVDGYLPDVDIATQKLYVVDAGGAQTIATSVPAAAPVTYSVPFPNNKAINGVANTIGVTTTCLVYVDNVLQLAIPNTGIYNPFTHSTVYTNPNLFSYTNGSSQQIDAGATGACQFSLSLSAGAHIIAVSALVTSPGDYDVSNNTTTQFQVTASSGPPDVQTLGALVQKNALTGLYEAPNLNSPTGAPVATTLYQQIAQKALTAPGSVICKVTVDGTDLATQPTVAPALNGVASTGYCAIPVTLAVGSHTIVVTAISTPTDGDASNNTATSTVVVANVVPISGTLGSTLSITDGVTKTSIVGTAASVLSGSTNHYAADVSLTTLLGMTGLVPVTCSVSIDGHAFDANSNISFVANGNTTTAAIAWDGTNGQNISVGLGTAVPCGFSLTLSESGNADVGHSIVVTAKSTVLNPASPVTTTTTGLITDLVRVDLAASAGQLVKGTSLVAITDQAMGQRDTLSAVFRNPDATHAVTFNCQVTIAAPDTSFHVLTTTPVTVAAGSTGECRWSIQPVFLQTVTFTAKATPTATSPIDPVLTNNSIVVSLGVKSTGKFTSFDTQNTFVQQEWYNSQTSATNWPIEKMGTQIVQVTQLALLVVPTVDGQLGTFGMSATATNGTTAFPTGTIGGVGTATGTLNASTGAMQCIAVGPKQPYANAAALGLPSQYGYFARICTQPTTFDGVAGFQQITVDYTQSVETSELTNTVDTPGKWAIQPSSNVDVVIRLDFKLANAANADFVSGTVRIPAGFITGSGQVDSRLPTMYKWYLDTHNNPPAQILQ